MSAFFSSRSRPRHSQRGFTLMEVLVAILIISLITVATTAAQRNALNTKKAFEEKLDGLKALERTMYWLSNDFSNLIDRPASNDLGEVENAVLAGQGGEIRVKFSRAGWRNPAPSLLPPRSSLQRVGYSLVGGRLVRLYWPQMDVASQVQPRRRLLLEEVEQFNLRFMDDKRQWHNDWPPASAGFEPDAPKPQLRGVEVSLLSETQGEFTRLFSVGG